MKHENGGTGPLIVLAALLTAEILWPQGALASTDSGPAGNFQFMALSLYNHGGKVPLIKAPSEAAAKAAYPLRLRKTTSVIALDCTVAKVGALKNCNINRSDPDDAKAKAAALRLSRRFKITSSYPYSSVTLFLRFRGAVDRCLEPFCLPELITPPPFVSTPH